jgi:GrpB-like predicted nucleotidyltransferase (UPF0157 family)
LRANIEHIGSTSIQDLGGKGIIDIVISVPKKDISSSIKKLQTNGYDYRKFGGDKQRKFFQKIIKYAGKERRVHVQLTYNNSHTFNAFLAVRNYLKNNKKAAKEYEKVKKKAFRYAKGEGKKYRAYKKRFLDKLEKIALKNLKKTK